MVDHYAGRHVRPLLRNVTITTCLRGPRPSAYKDTPKAAFARELVRLSLALITPSQNGDHYAGRHVRLVVRNVSITSRLRGSRPGAYGKEGFTTDFNE